ncbi:MAG: hypothetical protein U0797_24130 [Gemmataceae bacterium]
MAVNVTCCGCSRQLRLPNEVIGSKVSCPICKVVFLTRSRGDDRAEAIPVASAPASAPPPDEADLLPLEPIAPRGVPDLSLDDPPPAPDPRDPRRVPDPEPDTAPLRMIEDAPRPAAPPPPERRRRRRDDEDRPRKRRRDEDDDEATEINPSPRRREAGEAEDDRPRKRRREGEALARFAVWFHRDPSDRLSGRFDAEADAAGLKIWRGSGRVLEVPLGAECEYLGGGRLLVPIEGRKVELTTLHPDGLHDELAREVSAFVEKRQDTVTLPVRRRGPVVWLALLPLGLPLLGGLVGGLAGLVIWAAVAAVLASVVVLVVRQRGWSAGGRAWGASLISLAGYLILAMVARFSADGSGPATVPGPWCALAPVDGGFRAEVPGLPVKAASGLLAAPWALREAYCVNVNPANTAFVVAYGDSPAPGGADQLLASVARDFAQVNNGTVLTQRDLSLDGKKGVEFEIDSRDKGRLRGRAYAQDRRLFAVVFGSRRQSATGPEAERFLDSFRFDPATGWPGPPTPGVANAAVPPPPQANPFQPNKPPGADLGPGGKLLLQHDRPFVWCGVTPDGRLAVGLGEEGTAAFFDVADEREVGRLAVPAAAQAVAAAASPDGRTLAVAGSAGTLHLVDVLNRGVAPHPLAAADPNGLAQGAVAFSPDGKKLATGHAGVRCRLRLPRPEGRADADARRRRAGRQPGLAVGGPAGRR